MRNLITILHFWNIFNTVVDAVKNTISFSSPKFDVVPRAGLQSDNTAADGSHRATAAVGAVFCLPHLVTIQPEVGVVKPAVHLRLHAVAHPPGS